MDSQPLIRLIESPWVQLALGGIWQALIVVLTWRWKADFGRMAALVVLAVFPVAALVTRATNDLSERLAAIEELSEGAARSSEVESAFLSIGEKNPLALKRAHELYASTIQDLQSIAAGREPIANETDYLAVLTEELERTPNSGVIWDVVMPLNPARVGSPGRAPLLHYLDAVAAATSKRGIAYHLIVMPSEKDDDSVRKALDGFVARGVTLYVVDRNELPAALRDNFSLYERSKVVCSPTRGDDATILGGLRIRNDENELIARRQRLESIRAYAKPWSRGEG